MDLNLLKRRGRDEWHISPHGKMLVPGVIYATEDLVHDMDEKVYEQVTNVATLPGIVQASYAMPDAIRATGSRSVVWPRSTPIWEG
jgi:tRNA-splicing ligase RtcB